MIPVTSVSVDLLIGEAHLCQRKGRLASDLSAIDVAPYAIEKLLATYYGDDRKGLDADRLRIEFLTTVALLGGVVITQDDKGVDVRVQVFDSKSLYIILESGLRLTRRIVEAITLVRVEAIAVDVRIGVSVSGVLQIDGPARVIFAVYCVGITLARVVGN